MPLQNASSWALLLAAIFFVSPLCADDLPLVKANITPAQVGKFPIEVLQVQSTALGLPSDDVTDLVVTEKDEVFAGTAKGLARLFNGKWILAIDRQEPVRGLAIHGPNVIVIIGTTLFQYDIATNSVSILGTLPANVVDAPHVTLTSAARHIFLGSPGGLFSLNKDQFETVPDYQKLAGKESAVRQVAAGPNGELAVASLAGLFLRSVDGKWESLTARQGKTSWALHDVRAVTFDRAGKLWFGSAQGAGCRDGENWTLYTGKEGLPYDDFTMFTPGEQGVIWMATKIGAIRFDGQNWNYRANRRWTPDTDIRSIAVQSNGNAWLGTPNGIGLLERQTTTLAQKAKFFEDEIDKYHRRTPYGYVGGVSTAEPGQKVGIQQHDSDNDGLWTAMYGAGECFAYAATKDPLAKKRATAAFEALKFLSDVTQGGPHPAPKGFPARSILPVSGRNPNDHDSPEHDRERQKHDPAWKVLDPRWPVSADGQWYWKTDTSSDELDGHYFLYALYYDLVAETPEEKARVKQVVFDVTSHLVDHNYQLVDHDGQPTRWGRFNSEVLDHGHMIAARGLNCISILSYLRVASHVTGDPKFQMHYDKLVKEHSYAANTFNPKWAMGYGTGNQSDDEMAFMCYYNLLRYETNPELLKIYHYSLAWYWALERQERSPLFNYIFAAIWKSKDGYPVNSVPQFAIDDSVDTLKRFPLDRFDWGFKNSHRLDIIPLKDMWFRNTGYRVDGKVIPVDERYFEFWNHNPWRLDSGHNGRSLADGAAYLLPYYMGLHHGFIKETP